jgi:hypothetical protein
LEYLNNSDNELLIFPQLNATCPLYGKIPGVIEHLPDPTKKKKKKKKNKVSIDIYHFLWYNIYRKKNKRGLKN